LRSEPASTERTSEQRSDPPYSPVVGTPFSSNPLLRWLVGLYGVAWGVAALAPPDRQTWLLENLLVFAMLGLLCLCHRYFVFSNFSYALIFVFLLLHVVGAHYTYSAVPFADWVGGALGFERNHYDRVVHLGFGLLLGYPMRELVLRVMHVHRVWSYVVPVLAVVSLSAIYEMVESWAARIVDPEVGMAFVGAQGDIWDGQKDMSLALTGAVVAMALTACYRRGWSHEPYLGRRARG
jgi:putative membrane protein